ncbi:MULTISPECIES: DUF1538 family protein [Kocuria]|uniref:DUF1538 family protein n=1 Tax=Kocuria TaxID=57493 RepID=UPI001E457DE1|nr:hypothetical protein [Kocuria sp. CCUG 69068]
MEHLRQFAHEFQQVLRSLLPIVVVVVVSPFEVFRQPPENVVGLIAGLLAVGVGMTLFPHGPDLCVFPVGKNLDTPADPQENPLRSNQDVRALTAITASPDATGSETLSPMRTRRVKSLPVERQHPHDGNMLFSRSDLLRTVAAASTLADSTASTGPDGGSEHR